MESESRKPIEYFELDNRVNSENYETVAVKAEFDRQFVNSILSNSPYPLTKIAEIPDYTRFPEYVTALWIEKEFYYRISELRDQYQLRHSCGTICLILLILKRIEGRILGTRNISQQQSQLIELKKFVDFLKEHHAGKKQVNKIELWRGSKVADFDHGDYLLEQLYLYVQKYFDIINVDWWQLAMTKIPAEMSDKQKVTMQSLVRRAAIHRLASLVSDAKGKISERRFLLNQLFGSVNFLDYHFLKKDKNGKYNSEERERAIDRIKSQVAEARKLTTEKVSEMEQNFFT